MATRTFDQDATSVGHILSEGLVLTGARIGGIMRAMGPYGRRFALTGLGAVAALALGAGTASAFRLPSEVTDPTPQQDQTLALSELPSETAARTNALANPPVYFVKTDASDMGTDPSLVTPPDNGSTLAAYTIPSSDDAGLDADNAAPAPAQPAGANDSNP